MRALRRDDAAQSKVSAASTMARADTRRQIAGVSEFRWRNVMSELGFDNRGQLDGHAGWRIVAVNLLRSGSRELAQEPVRKSDSAATLLSNHA